jgi:hypothetical protein
MQCFLSILCALALAVLWHTPAHAADTAGTATLTVQLSSAGGNYAPRHVVAVWVTNAALGYVKCLWKDGSGWTGEGTTHLTKLKAARGSSTVLDGHSGATINTYNLFTVTWNCSNANNTALAPDGVYYFHVETTDRNGAGPYSGGLPMVKGPTPFSTNYPNQTYIKNLALHFTPAAPSHDIALASLTPQVVTPNTTADLRLILTNRTQSAETNISITLSNATTASVIGSQTLSSLAAGASVNLYFPWNTTGLASGDYSLVAWAGAVPGETSTANNRLSQLVTIRPPTHDIAVARIDAPAQALPQSRTNISVTVTNKGDFAEGFTLSLEDLTDGQLVGTNRFAAIAPQGSASVTFPWGTTNASWGNHSLRARVETLPGETVTADNELVLSVLVSPPPQLRTYLTKSNLWRYSDAGADLGSAWRQPGYNDAAWSSARGPFGFGDTGITTTIRSNMPGTTARIPTTYFRSTFIGTPPLPTNLVMNLRRDDGAVVYHNGVEVYRIYLTNQPVLFSHWANTSVGGDEELAYFAIPISPTNTVAGTNVIAVELHQNSSTSSDASFDLELIGTSPPFLPVHDIAIHQFAAPAQALPGSVTQLQVAVTNLGHFNEQVQVLVTDVTDSASVGTAWIPQLRTNATEVVTIPWTVPAIPYVQHTLQAVAVPVLSETRVSDNTNAVTVLVSPIMETLTLLAGGAAWRFNDQGLDLTEAPWKSPDYYDQAWSSGAAPLGYGLAGLNTQLGFGPDPQRKHPTCYLRTELFVDALPVSLTLRARRDDGAIVYLNGQELARLNAPPGPVRYSDYFGGFTVSGADESAYFTTQVASDLLVLGRNVVAVEVHQDRADSSDLAFDLEITGSAPLVARTHDVAPLAVHALADGLVGDRLAISVTVTNRGNVTEFPQVILQEVATGRVLGTRTLSPLVPGGAASVNFDWPTVGVEPGLHAVKAAVVMGGVTNFAQALSTPVTLTSSGFGLKRAAVAGAVGGRCTALALDGSRLVLGAGASLEVWDISAPRLPVRLGSVRLPGTIESVLVSGARAYAACGSAGVQFIDLSSPAAPLHSNTFDTSGHASGLALEGRYLFVADGGSGLRIIDVGAPGAPALVGAYYTQGPARAIRVAGNRAFLLDAEAGLLILDCGDPSQPRLLGSFSGIDAGRDLAVVGTLSVVVDANNHGFVLDVSDATQPRLLNTSNTVLLPGLASESIVLHGSSAYVTAAEGGLAILDLASPASPAAGGRFATPGQAMQSAISGTTLYVADGLGGLLVCDISQPANPVLQTQHALSIRAHDVAVQGDRALVAAGEAGVRIFDVSNPAAPALLATYAGARNARCIATSGTTAVVGDGPNGVQFLDVSAPGSPALLGTWPSPDLASVRSVGISGSRVLASDGWRVCLLDIGTPANPRLIATRTLPGFGFQMAVSGSHAYLACGAAGLAVFDLGAAALAPASLTPTDGLASGISVSGSTAHVAHGERGWSLYDITSPAAPALIKTHTSQGPVTAVAVSGVLAALSGSARNAITLDISQPLAPVPVQAFDGLAQALRLKAAGDHIYAVEDDAGLAILSASQSPLVLRVSPPAGGVSGLTIQWVSRAGKTYAIHRTTDLALGRAGFVLVRSGIAASPPLNTFTLEASAPSAFYVISEQ